MMVSTKGRYALRVMIDLAQQGGAGYIPLKDIAQRQGLSEKYLESIVKLLARNGDLAGGGVRKSGIPAGKLEKEERGNRRDMKQLMHQNEKKESLPFPTAMV